MTSSSDVVRPPHVPEGRAAFWPSASRCPATAGANTLRAPKSVAKEAVDSWLTITPDNKVTIFVGKVDLGTGSRTALMQLAADELDVAFERIEMVMGDTATHARPVADRRQPDDLPGRRGTAPGGGERAPRAGRACGATARRPGRAI